MPRQGAIALGATVAVGLSGLTIAWGSRETSEVQTLGVLPVLPVAPIAAGQEACQTPIGLAEDLRRVRFNVGTNGKPGTALEVTVREPSTGRALGSGRVQPGWIDDGTAQNVPVGFVPKDRFVSVCIRNRGPVRAFVFGDIYKGRIGTGPIGVRPTVTTSYATIDGEQISGDLSMSFVAAKPRSLLSLVPAMFSRASLFRPGFVGAWTYWVMLVAAVGLAPLALWRALVRAEAGAATEAREPRSDSVPARINPPPIRHE